MTNIFYRRVFFFVKYSICEIISYNESYTEYEINKLSKKQDCLKRNILIPQKKNSS